MSSREIREPKQQRSIEKRKKIIDAGFKLFCEKGYHATNTVEIAKLAGVSTGIVYNYFVDKKDIFIAALDACYNSMLNPVLESLVTIEKPIDVSAQLRKIIKMLNESHTAINSAYEELEAMASMDKDIREFYCQCKQKMVTSFLKILEVNDITPTHPYEKLYITINIVENLCHEMVYHQHEYINYEVMTEEAIKVIVDMLSS